MNVYAKMLTRLHGWSSLDIAENKWEDDEEE
ncbi:hypothetical protein GvMRE_Ic3g137 [endosymbiont GvMRE of Glomus versiforme]|nr:hypothetical protein GvMRE_Ic3g137 [endosymbiont GvMRE of Glomus versiforme]